MSVPKSTLERVAAINNHLYQYYFTFNTDINVLKLFSAEKAEIKKKTTAIEEAKANPAKTLGGYFINLTQQKEDDSVYQSSMTKLRDKMHKNNSDSSLNKSNSANRLANVKKDNSEKSGKAFISEFALNAVSPVIPYLQQFVNSALMITDDATTNFTESMFMSTAFKPAAIEETSGFGSTTSQFLTDDKDHNMVDFYRNFEMGTRI